jgi:hypothetical protein
MCMCKSGSGDESDKVYINIDFDSNQSTVASKAKLLCSSVTILVHKFMMPYAQACLIIRASCHACYFAQPVGRWHMRG